MMADTGVGWAIFFDAVGTILHPVPSAAEIYHQVGRQLGSQLSLREVTQRFRAAWKDQEQRDSARLWRTDELWEEQRWRFLVAQSLPDVTDAETCFQQLYDHFARPDTWAIDAGIVPLLNTLRQAGFQLGLASNFDGRLRGILAQLPQLASLQHLVISSEIGWRKPSSEFFSYLVQQVDLPAERIIVVGDDPINDYQGALQAGMLSILYQPGDKTSSHQIGSWNELPTRLESFLQKHS